MPPEITEEEYQKIYLRLKKLLALYKNEDINDDQLIAKVFDCFFVQK